MLDLSTKRKIKGAKFWTSEINQLYRPTVKFHQDSQEIVYTSSNLNTTKFSQILLKEWFYLIKNGGYLIIDYKQNKLCDFQKLEENMWWLWKSKYEIVFHGPIKTSQTINLNKNKVENFIKKPSLIEIPPKNYKGHLRFICKKLVSTKVTNDEITKWTIGIITNGKRNVWVEQIIKSIRQQKIPNYEIIICGTYFARKDKDIIYICFSRRTEKGWITKAKNLIVKRARYENICIVHDRIVFRKNWYKGMKKWGNAFEWLNCYQLYGKQRVNDWVAKHHQIFKNGKEYLEFGSLTDPKDWYSTNSFYGQVNIFKKSIMINNNLWYDENLYYGDAEDRELSKKFHSAGLIHRFNPYSSVQTLTFRDANPTYAAYNPISTTPKMIINNKSAIIKIIVYYSIKTLDFLHIAPPFNTILVLRNWLYIKLLALNQIKMEHHKRWRKEHQETGSFNKLLVK